jgi:hypothetical protein
LAPTAHIAGWLIHEHIQKSGRVTVSEPSAAYDYFVPWRYPGTKLRYLAVNTNIAGGYCIVGSAAANVKPLGNKFVESEWFVGHSYRPL